MWGLVSKIFTARTTLNKFQLLWSAIYSFGDWERSVKAKSIKWTLSKTESQKSIKDQRHSRSICHFFLCAQSVKTSHIFNLEENFIQVLWLRVSYTWRLGRNGCSGFRKRSWAGLFRSLQVGWWIWISEWSGHDWWTSMLHKYLN